MSTDSFAPLVSEIKEEAIQLWGDVEDLDDPHLEAAKNGIPSEIVVRGREVPNSIEIVYGEYSRAFDVKKDGTLVYLGAPQSNDYDL